MDKRVVVEAKNEDVVLRALKDRRTDIIIGFEKNSGKDFMHSRNSGLNQVFCKLAHDNDIIIGFDFNDLVKAKDKAGILGKMIQNVMLCTKYKVKMFVFDSKKKRLDSDLKAFASVIGMNSNEVAHCTEIKKKQRDIEVVE